MSPSVAARRRGSPAGAAGALLVWLLAACAFPVVAQETGPEAMEPPGPGPLEGRLLGADGRPLQGAAITLRPLSGEHGETDAVSKTIVVRSDEEGRFSSGEVTGTAFDVRIQAAGHAFQTWPGWRLETGPLNVTLEPGQPVTGRVLTKTTGGGIAGLRVEIDDREEFDLGPGAVVTTDIEGRYRFPHVPAGDVWVRATGTGWARRTARDEVLASATAGQPTVLEDLWLTPGGDVAGRVVDTRGRPIPGARLVLSPVDVQHTGRQLLFTYRESRTDEKGRYEFQGVTAGGKYRVRAEHDSYSPAAVGPLDVEAGTVLSDVDLTLGTGATLQLKLVDGEDRPYERVTVHLKAEEPHESDLSYSNWKRSTEDGGVVAGEDGRLSLERLSAGRYTVRIEPHDGVEVRQAGVVLTEGETTDLGTIELQPGSTLRGRVMDESGDPVAAATVSVRWQTMSGRYERQRTTDSAGRFTVGGLPEHSLKLEVSADDFAEQVLNAVKAGSNEVVVTLVRRGGIRGSVKLADGGPPKSFTVLIFDDRQYQVSPVDAEIEAGSFEVRHLNPGTYGVEVRSPGKAPGRLDKVVVRAGRTADAGEFSLRPGLEVTGRVFVADGGGPVAGASVRLDRGGGPPRWREETGQRVTVSDPGGRFEIDGLEAGRFTLTLFHPRFAPAQRSIELDADRRETVVEIRMSAGGEIAGVVVDQNGLAVSGANLLIYRGSRGFDMRLTSTDDDGSFRFARLGVGTYIVMLNRLPGQTSFNPRIKTIDLREGQVKEVRFSVPAD